MKKIFFQFLALLISLSLILNNFSIAQAMPRGSMNFDAHQNHRYYIQTGWWIGLTAPIFSIIGAAIDGGGKAALQTYVNQNPLLASVHALATKRVGGLEGALAIITNGAALINAAGLSSTGANNTVNISDALAKQFNPLAGMNINFAGGLNAIANGQNPLTALNGCAGQGTNCQLLAGLSLRFTTWNNRKNWTETTISRLTAARDLTLTAGQDLHLVGGTIAQTGRDATLVAGRNVALSAVADLSSSSSTQRGFTFSIRQSGFSIGVDGSDSSSNSKVYSNAVLAAARDSVIMAGQDIALAGANIRAKNVYLDAGRDLLLTSMQNLSTYVANNYGFTFGVTITPTGPLPSFSVSGGGTTANRKYTDTPTTIIADEKLDAVVGRHTILAGAGMWSKTGALKLDTADLAFDNFQDSDHYNNWNFSAGIDFAAQNILQAVSGGFHRDYKNVDGITFATIGAGDITLRDQQGTANLYNLNRDVGSMQRLIRSSSGNFGVPELNLLKVAEDIKGAARVINAVLANVPDNVREAGQIQVNRYQNMIIRGASREAMTEFVNSGGFALTGRMRETIESAQKAGIQPSAGQLAMVMQLEGAVYHRSESGDLTIQFPCPTLGVCGYTLGQFDAIFGNEAKKIALKDVLEKGVSLFTSTNSVLKDSLENHFKTMMRCAIEEPEVFRQFMTQYGTQARQMAQQFLGSTAAIDAISAETFRAGATKTSIESVYNASLTWTQKAVISDKYSKSNLAYFIGDTADFGARLAQGDATAQQELQYKVDVLRAAALYIKDHPYEFTKEQLVGFADLLNSVFIKGDATTIGELPTKTFEILLGGGLAKKAVDYAIAKGAISVGARGALTTQLLAKDGIQTLADGTKLVDANLIRFSQRSVNGSEVNALIESMNASGWVGDASDVVRMGDGALTSLDNKRLLAAATTNTTVKANIRAFDELLDATSKARFEAQYNKTLNTWGEAITERIKDQRAAYSKVYPNGSKVTGVK